MPIELGHVDLSPVVTPPTRVPGLNDQTLCDIARHCTDRDTPATNTPAGVFRCSALELAGTACVSEAISRHQVALAGPVADMTAVYAMGCRCHGLTVMG